MDTSSKYFLRLLNDMDEHVANNKKHARFLLSGELGTVKLSAESIDEYHRDKTLKTWKSLKVKNVQVVEQTPPEPLPRWEVAYFTKGEKVTLELNAPDDFDARDALEKRINRRPRFTYVERKETADAATKN